MFKVFRFLISYIVVQFALIFLLAFYFTSKGYNSNYLPNFINDNKIYMVLILAIIFIPLLLYNYKKLNIKKEKENIFNYIIFTIFLSIGYNIVAYYIDKHILLSDLYSFNTNLIVSLISTVLIGPIIEELMFRGIMYNELKKISNIKKTMLITTITFCLCHFNLIQLVYTFIFGYFLVIIYNKNRNINYVIILHMISNLVTTFISLFIIKDYIITNIILLFISIVMLYLSNKKLEV